MTLAVKVALNPNTTNQPIIWDIDEADNVKKSLILHFDIVKIKTSLDERKVDVIPLLRAIEKGVFILRLPWDLDKSVMLNRTM